MEKFWSSIKFKTIGVQIAGALVITISLAFASYIIFKQHMLRTHLNHSHMIVRAASDELRDFYMNRMSLMRNVMITLAVIMVLTIIASIILSEQITKRVIELSDATAHIARGNFSLKVPVNSSDEIGSLATSFNLMVDTLRATTVSRAELEEKSTFLYHVVDSISYPFFVVNMNDLTVILANNIVREKGDFKAAACYPYGRGYRYSLPLVRRSLLTVFGKGDKTAGGHGSPQS